MMLLFVYNADSGFVNALSDAAHKMFFPETYPCSLGKLGYGPLMIKKEWKEFLRELPFKVVFLHKDEFCADYPQFSHMELPAAFTIKGDTIFNTISSSEINGISDLYELIDLVSSKLETK